MEVTDSEIEIIHTITDYARTVLTSPHGLLWALFTAGFISLTLSTRFGLAAAIAAIAQLSVLFALYLGLLHILRFHELPGNRHHVISKQDIESVDEDVALTAESWKIYSLYRFMNDGDEVTVIPRRRYQDKFRDDLVESGYLEE